MSNFISNKLELVKKLVDGSKFEEGLQIIKDIEQRDDLFPGEMLKTLNYKSWACLGVGQYERSFEIAEELYQKSQELNLPQFSLDALLRKEMVLLFGDHDEVARILEQRESLFNSIPREVSIEYKEREASLWLMKGVVNNWRGNNDVALKYHAESIKLSKETNSNYLLCLNYMSMTYVYDEIGEITLAIEYGEKSLSLIPERENFSVLSRKATIYNKMGMSYYSKGDLERALECNIQSLEFSKKTQGRVGIGVIYMSVIAILLAKNDLEKARSYLHQFKEYNANYGSTEYYSEFRERFLLLLYQCAKALILKKSDRMRDRVEAENILKKIVKEEDPNADPYLFEIVLTNLCGLYFEEFRFSHNMEILDEIQPLIIQLQNLPQTPGSFSSLANLKLLQAKLALLQVSMVEARKLLTEAQKIANEHGLRLLAKEISREHDHLLEELKLWESFKKTQASVEERLKLASIDSVMERLQGRSAIEVPEVSIEEPILLLIMDKSGVSYFNYSFISDWDFDDLFSSFMSAFNDFSGEIFSRSIDRIKIGENIILKSYPAQQKLIRFSDIIKASSEIWDALTKARNTGEMLQLNDPPSLGSYVNEIFIG
ncbi:MAG: tetratricopeptide repeat protein [Promethearchaeota archaeon]|jgi:tetratricopeptide (TPR) repeat protein